MKHKVVVLISLYEPMPFLRAKIENLNQCNLDGALVYFSDCSPAATWTEVEKLIKSGICKFEFCLDHHTVRRTLYWTWDWMINNTFGDATYYCNSNVDDLNHPEYFVKMAKMLDENPGLLIVASPWYTTHKRDQSWPPTFHQTTVPDTRNTCGHFPMWRAALHHAGQVGLFNPDFKAMGDAEFWHRIRKRYGGNSLGVHKEVLGCYLAHDNNLYATADKIQDMLLLPYEMRPKNVPALKDSFNCRRCSGGNMKRVITNNINTPQYWDRVYEKESTQHHPRLDKERLAQLERWIRIRHEELGHYPYVLDVGCGLAEVERYFAKLIEPVRFRGIDVGEETIEMCRQKYSRPGVRFDVGSATSIPDESEAFDIVWCGETIEHLDDPEKAIKEMARVTGQGGFLILTTPYRGRNRDKEHVWEFEPDDMARWAKSIGDLVFLDCRLLEGWLSMFAVIRKARPENLT